MAGEKNTFRFRRSVFEDACRRIYEEGGMDDPMMSSPEITALIEETYRVIGSAVDKGLREETSAELRYALENNAFIFSGFKTYHSLREAGLSMIGEDGKVKPFSSFLQDVRRINDRYNRHWLRAEYNHALASSQMAAKWKSLEGSTDRYMLQYRTARDARVREEHAALDGITLPADDPFWDMYYPPNGWNCRCNAVQVRRAKYAASDPDKAMRLGNEATEGPKKVIFRFNAGRTMQVFPPRHPYYKAPEKARKAISGLKRELKRPSDIVGMVNSSEEMGAWFEHGFQKLLTETSRKRNGATDLRGTIWLRKERISNVISAVNKLRNGEGITFDEADSMATFWHEITHNRHKGSLKKMKEDQIVFMEMANEFVARKTLPEFYRAWGAEMQYPEFMNDRRSTGYNGRVRNYDTLIRKTGADAGKVLEHVMERLFNGDYSEQLENLSEALVKGGARRQDGKAFEMHELRVWVTRCWQFERLEKNSGIFWITHYERHRTRP